MSEVEFIGSKDDPLAIVVRAITKVENIEFFTAPNSNFQVGLMSRPKGYKVPSHFHNPISRNIVGTQEVLFIRKGACKISISDGVNFQMKILLSKGDVILLAKGTHSIEMISDCEILEVKQGPFIGAEDKTILESVE